MNFFRITYKLISLSSLAVIAVGVTYIYSLSSDKKSSNLKQKAYRKKWLQKIVKVIGLEVQVNGNVSGDLVNAVEGLANVSEVVVNGANNYPDKADAFTNTTDRYANKADGSKMQSALWVSNHISWMDIAVVGSQGAGFLSKSEVRKWPVIGWLGDKSGTVFIDRGGKNASRLAAKAIAEKIFDGDNILVFPEGTTSSGENVKRFHARIFAPALDHQLSVQPIVIQYLDEQGLLHPKASWDDQHFMRNMMGVLAQSNIRVILTFLPAIDPSQFSERRKLAELVENQIRDVVLSPNTKKIA